MISSSQSRLLEITCFRCTPGLIIFLSVNILHFCFIKAYLTNCWKKNCKDAKHLINLPVIDMFYVSYLANFVYEAFFS